eukprot:2561237-Rhodomonas_salina.2
MLANGFHDSAGADSVPTPQLGNDALDNSNTNHARVGGRKNTDRMTLWKGRTNTDLLELVGGGREHAKGEARGERRGHSPRVCGADALLLALRVLPAGIAPRRLR